MRNWLDGFMSAVAIVILSAGVAYWTGYLKIYGIGVLGVGRLFCFQGP